MNILQRIVRPSLKAIDAGLFSALRFVVASVIIAMLVITMTAIVRRYVLNAPLQWSEELARYLMFYMVLLGAALGLRGDVHPRLTLVLDHLSGRLRRMWQIVLDLATTLLLLVIFIEGWKMAVDEAISLTPALQISFFWVYLALPLGTGVMLLQLLLRRLFGDKST